MRKKEKKRKKERKRKKKEKEKLRTKKITLWGPSTTTNNFHHT